MALPQFCLSKSLAFIAWRGFSDWIGSKRQESSFCYWTQGLNKDNKPGLIYWVIWKSISVCQIGKQSNILYFGKIHTEWIYDSVHFCEFRNCSDKSHGRVPFMFIAGIVCKWNPNYFDHLQVLKGISLKSCQNLTVCAYMWKLHICIREPENLWKHCSCQRHTLGGSGPGKRDMRTFL